MTSFENYRAPTRRVSLLRVVTIDTVTVFLAAFPIVFWGLFIAFAFGFLPASGTGHQMRAESPVFYLHMAIGATLLFGPFLVWRFRSLQSLFARGEEVRGRITSVHTSYTAGIYTRIDYSFTFRGKEYECFDLINFYPKTRKLRKGDEITLIVDPIRPTISNMRDLYLANDS